YYYWLYNKKELIEAYDKELSVIPIKDLNLTGFNMPEHRTKKINEFLEKHEKRLNELIKFIKVNGVTCSKDFDKKEKVNDYWGTRTWSNLALDFLWKTGKLSIDYRKNNRKYYDLMEEVYKEKFPAKKELTVELVLRRLDSIGLLPASGTGYGWLGIGKGAEIKPIIRKLVKEKVLTKIQLNQKTCLVGKTSDLKEFEKLKTIKTENKMSFLSPLDNLLWDRKMVKEIFGFEYKWEAYTPIHKRTFGHYVLPVLCGTKFIGRIEPKHNKKENVLEIKGFWLEKNVEWNNELEKALKDNLKCFQEYLQAKTITWNCKKP
ncbi:MAG: crosslink repair DNA glycosylase YcaQ family protein, partial [archaeon]